MSELSPAFNNQTSRTTTVILWLLADKYKPNHVPLSVLVASVTKKMGEIIKRISFIHAKFRTGASCQFRYVRSVTFRSNMVSMTGGAAGVLLAAAPLPSPLGLVAGGLSPGANPPDSGMSTATPDAPPVQPAMRYVRRHQRIRKARFQSMLILFFWNADRWKVYDECDTT